MVPPLCRPREWEGPNMVSLLCGPREWKGPPPWLLQDLEQRKEESPRLVGAAEWSHWFV